MPHARRASNLAGVSAIRHGFFTRRGGVSHGIFASLNCGQGSGDEPAHVLENRRRVAEALGASAGLVTLYQEHGVIALSVDKAIAREGLPRADAVVTATPGLAVGVLTADCAPVLLADPEARVVAAAHAGWRGATAGILESAVTEMERLGAHRGHIIAAIGPCINQTAYEVGEDFARDVLRQDPAAEAYFARPNAGERPHFDLPGYAAMRLGRAGVGHVELAAPCTYENESEFFSYRRATHHREPDYGRQISAIVVA